MFEKVNPCHPDKIADRIAGAIVDLAYKKAKNPRVAVEVLIGHGVCHIIAETSVRIGLKAVKAIVARIAGETIKVDFKQTKQDEILAGNQANGFRCGDNGIFRGMPETKEQEDLCWVAYTMHNTYQSDGKYIMDGDNIYVCQSNAPTYEIEDILHEMFGNQKKVLANPLGNWTGGTDVDCGATNRKLGSDMGDAVTGGGLHGKDLSKADVSVNIYAHLRAEQTGKPVELSCAIGDTHVDGLPYSAIVEIARDYINRIGGFEKFAEWGLVI